MPYTREQQKALYAQGKGHLVQKYHALGGIIDAAYMACGGAVYKQDGGLTTAQKRKLARHGRLDKASQRYNEGSKAITARDVLEFVPVIGDILAAEEVYRELQKEPINWTLVGILTAGTAVGVIPGIGDAAAAAIKKGGKALLSGSKKAVDTLKQYNLEIDPSALGMGGGNIRIVKKGSSDRFKVVDAETGQPTELYKKDKNIYEGIPGQEGFDVNEYNKDFVKISNPYPVNKNAVIIDTETGTRFEGAFTGNEGVPIDYLREQGLMTQADVDKWAEAQFKGIGDNVTGRFARDYRSLLQIMRDPKLRSRLTKDEQRYLFGPNPKEFAGYDIPINRKSLIDKMAAAEAADGLIPQTAKQTPQYETFVPKGIAEKFPEFDFAQPKKSYYPGGYGKIYKDPVTGELPKGAPKVEEGYTGGNWDLNPRDKTDLTPGTNPNVSDNIPDKMIETTVWDPKTGSFKNEMVNIKDKKLYAPASGVRDFPVEVQEIMPYISSIMAKMNKMGFDSADIIEAKQDGILAALEALQSYKPGSNTKFFTYAHDKVKYAMINRSGIDDAKKRALTLAAEKSAFQLDDVVGSGKSTARADTPATGHEIIPSKPLKDFYAELPAEYRDLARLLNEQAESRIGGGKLIREGDKVTRQKVIKDKDIAADLGISLEEFANQKAKLKVIMKDYLDDIDLDLYRKPGKSHIDKAYDEAKEAPAHTPRHTRPKLRFDPIQKWNKGGLVARL